jgi:hypothetical protein
MNIEPLESRARLEGDREHFNTERQGYVSKLIAFSRSVGELTTQVLQLGGKPQSGEALPKGSEDNGNVSETAFRDFGANEIQRDGGVDDTRT